MFCVVHQHRHHHSNTKIIGATIAMDAATASYAVSRTENCRASSAASAAALQPSWR